MGKLKSIDWKELAFKVVDKIVIAICAAFALWAVWGAFSLDVFRGDPNVIVQNAAKAKSTIAKGTWPEEEAAKFQIDHSEMPQEVVRLAIREPVQAGAFDYEQPFYWSRHATKEPLKEPVWLAVESLLADESQVLIPLKPTQDDFVGELELEDSLATAKKEVEEESDIPEEFRIRRGSGVGATGPFGAEGAPSGFVDPYDPTLGGEVDFSDAYGAADTYSTQGVDAEGRQYVAVRGVYPLRDQVRKIQTALNLGSYFEARPFFDLMDVKIERRVFRPGDDPEQAEWESVDIRVAEDVLSSANGQDLDPVSPQITDPVITMPLPARVVGQYLTKATHPRIEDFVLSEDELAQEVKILSAMTEEIKKRGEEQKLNAPAQKGGFSNVSISSSSVYNAFNSGFEDYSGAFGGAGPYGGAPTGAFGNPGGFGGGGFGSPYAGGAFGGQGYGNDPYAAASPQLTDQALEKLLETLDPDKKESKLKDIIKKRVSAVDELLLFRYLDFDVQSNRSYQYRVQLEVRNPNFGRNVGEAGGLAHVVEGETRLTGWSQPSKVATTPRTTDFYLARVKPARARAPMTAEIDVFQWDPNFGTTIQSVLTVEPGQLIGGLAETEVLDPAAPSLENQSYEFQSEDVLLTGRSDNRIDKEFHEDLTLPPGSNGGELFLPEMVVYADDAGVLHSLDEVSLFAQRVQQRNILKKVREQFAYLKPQVTEETDELGQYFDEFGFDGAGPNASDLPPGFGGGYPGAFGGGGAYPGGARVLNPLAR